MLLLLLISRPAKLSTLFPVYSVGIWGLGAIGLVPFFRSSQVSN